MAKVLVGDDCIDIRPSWLERTMLAEKSRKLPLSRVRGVNPHPPLLEMMVHWADQGSVWLGGVSSFEGHMIPSTRNPRSTLAIQLDGDDEPDIYVEVDDEPPEVVAQRISRAIGSEPPPPAMGGYGVSAASPRAQSRVALEIARAQQLDEEEDEEQDEEPVVALDRQALLPDGTRLAHHPAHESWRAMFRLSARASDGALRRSGDLDLARLSSWLLVLGVFAMIAGTIAVATGAFPGLLAVGAGIVCGALGGIARAAITHRFRERRARPPCRG